MSMIELYYNIDGVFPDGLNTINGISAYDIVIRRKRKWKEHTSLRSFIEKKSTALWRECPQRTAVRYLPAEEQRAESSFPIDLFVTDQKAA